MRVTNGWSSLLVSSLVLGCGGRPQPPAAPPPEPMAETPAPQPAPQAPSLWPSTRRVEVVDTLHGVAVADPYRWLEKGTDPEVVEWMTAQDRVTRSKLEELPRREKLRARFQELVYIDAVSAPFHEGNRYFYSRSHATKEKRVVYFRDGEKGAEQVLFDPNTMSDDGSISLRGWVPSQDGKRVAYKLSKNNADAATIHVRDVDSGKDLPDVIEGGKYASPSWTPDGKGFYYTWLPTDPTIPVDQLPGHAEVRFHALGTDPKADTVIHPALGDPKKFIGVDLSRDGRWLLFYVEHGWNRTDVYFRDLKTLPKKPAEDAGPTERAGFRPLIVGQDALYTVHPWKGTFYVHTNEGAPRYRVFKVDPKKPERAAWKEIVAQRSDATLEGTDIVGNHLVLQYLRNATSEMEIHRLDGSLVRKVELPGIGTASGMVGQPHEDDAYFSFTSFTMMPQIFRTSIKTGKTSLWETTKYPADTSQMTSEQVWYHSKDGTKVSMFLVHRKGMERNGDNPVKLYGYGGFNVTITPYFAPWVVVWLEHGGVVAIPNLRGGGEYGEEWHRSGMLAKKQNVFDDFIAAAEWLIAEKITRPERLAIEGGSNGGLLVGAAMTQRPDLFRAVICKVPLLDMLRYHLFGSGRTWIEEYGSSDDPELFRALHAYSPYHRVKEGSPYPALLMLSADSDDRVDPMHARKFVAAVQQATSARHPIWLRVEKNAGHGGADLKRQAVEEQADVGAFLMAELGVE